MLITHDKLRLCLVVALTLLLGTPARAQAQRFAEVESAVRQYYLYAVPPAAYTRAAQAAAAAAGERTVPGGALVDALSALTARHPDRADAIATAAIRAFTEGLGDPYTTWLSPQDKAALDAQQSGQAFTGIGVEVAPDPKGLRVVAALEGSPARAAGLRPGDVILAVDGRPLAGLGLYRASDTLLGQVGTPVSLTLARGRVQVTRAQLVLPPVRARMLSSGGKRVGYLRIAIFGPQTATQARDAIGQLGQQGAQGFIFDLRDNPGGALKSALDVAALVVPGHLLLRVQRKSGAEEERRAPGPEADASKPIVILLSRGSASSSEVLAGALSDHHVATLMGERSFGKGVIQTVVPLQNGSALRLTTARYKTPNGRDIHGKGLEPDISSSAEGNQIIEQALQWIAARVK